VEVVKVNGNILTFDDGSGLSFNLDLGKIDPNQPDGCFSPAPGSLPMEILPGEQLVGVEWIEIVRLKISNTHDIVLRQDGMSYYTNGSGTLPSESATMLAGVIWGTTPPPGGTPGGGGGLPSVTNPTVLEPGFYDTVTVNDNFDAPLSSAGTYVIKNLIIEEGSHLTLPDNGVNAKFYVTESLRIRGVNAIANATLKPPKVKVFYTGDEAVDLSGGSRSYFTLVAPDADIHLKSPFGEQATEFFGALVGDTVDVTNANFHFDTATSGIGTGTMGSAVSLIQRHRL
jgi:hypothetical protein